MDRYHKRVLRLRKHVSSQQNKIVVEDDLLNKPMPNENKDNNAIDIDSMTKPEIIEILTQNGIEHNPRDKKEVLYDLMAKGDLNV